MAYGRDYGFGGPRHRREYIGRGEYGPAYEGPQWGGYDVGYEGDRFRSRGSWNAGARQMQRGYGDEFEWGGGYIGGRGYGGTNYDLQQGYRTNYGGGRPRGGPMHEETRFSSPASRGGYSWGEEASVAEEYGPARYGYGPYFDRLQRRRRPDEEVRAEVEDTLFYDTWVDADSIQIRVQDGVITLSGELPSYDEVRYAVDDAWDVDGVRGVHCELTVGEEAGQTARGGRGEEENETARGGRSGRGTRQSTGRGSATGATTGSSGAGRSSRGTSGGTTGGRSASGRSTGGTQRSGGTTGSRNAPGGTRGGQTARGGTGDQTGARNRGGTQRGTTGGTGETGMAAGSRGGATGANAGTQTGGQTNAQTGSQTGSEQRGGTATGE